MYLFLLFALLTAAPALAQTPLDWSDGDGSIVLPAADQDGDPAPAGTVVTCYVALNAVPFVSVTGSPGNVIQFFSIPKGRNQTTATADCEWDLLPGVRGDVDTKQLLLRPFKAPQKPDARS